uniref:Vps41 beta-propeller domain-containing protein n=1 Tax=Physcomitrium patens TaxID=3218 RepID=A0A7I4EJW6_PHYPA
RESLEYTVIVNEVNFDSSGEDVGICFDDSSVVISSSLTAEKDKFEDHRPVNAFALDPKTSLIAWANSAGIKLYDTASHQCVTTIEQSPRTFAQIKPLLILLVLQIVLVNDTLILVEWADCIKIAVLRTRGWDGLAGTLGSGTKHVEIRRTLQPDNYMSGLALFGDQLVFLAYFLDQEDCEGYAHQPEARIVTRRNKELATDTPSIHYYDHYRAKDYVLAHAPFIGANIYLFFQDNCGLYVDYPLLKRHYNKDAELCPKLLLGSAPALDWLGVCRLNLIRIRCSLFGCSQRMITLS